MRVMLIGGYGVFGARLSHLLARLGGFELVIAGRNESAARELCASLSGIAQPFCLDITDANLAEKISDQNPGLIVHCAGPFQGQQYGVARACIKAGIPYADLSDGREFVHQFGSLDDVARKNGVCCLTGASTTPALTGAVVDYLAQDISQVRHIEIGISPGNRAPRGIAVMQSILGYCGEKMPRFSEGDEVMVTGWGSLVRNEISGLGLRWFSPCDTPDMITLPKNYPEAEIYFRAGLELSFLHLALFGLSRLRAMRLLPNLAGITPLLHPLAKAFESFGTDRGGMYVFVKGLDNSQKIVSRRWYLRAEGGNGPNIPVMAAAAIARKIRAGEHFRAGAYACYQNLTLQDFEQLFKLSHITTMTDEIQKEKS